MEAVLQKAYKYSFLIEGRSIKASDNTRHPWVRKKRNDYCKIWTKMRVLKTIVCSFIIRDFIERGFGLFLWTPPNCAFIATSWHKLYYHQTCDQSPTSTQRGSAQNSGSITGKFIFENSITFCITFLKRIVLLKCCLSTVQISFLLKVERSLIVSTRLKVWLCDCFFARRHTNRAFKLMITNL